MKPSLLIILLCLCASQAHAMDEAQAGEEEELFAEAIPESELELRRGASGFNPAVLNTAELNAVNTGNTVYSGTTGYNMIGDNAFQNSNGVINVVQNSGNGVVIQNSTIVNLTLQ